MEPVLLGFEGGWRGRDLVAPRGIERSGWVLSGGVLWVGILPGSLCIRCKNLLSEITPQVIGGRCAPRYQNPPPAGRQRANRHTSVGVEGSERRANQTEIL
jgi:hypothetical protein